MTNAEKYIGITIYQVIKEYHDSFVYSFMTEDEAIRKYNEIKKDGLYGKLLLQKCEVLKID